MRDSENNKLKAYAREYEETPFFFEKTSEHGAMLVAWSGDRQQVQSAFYEIVERLPWDVNVLLKIAVGEGPSSNKPLWVRYHDRVDRSRLIMAIENNAEYIFSDGMHQLCVKDPESDRYLAFDDHGIFFLYQPLLEDTEFFETLGFKQRKAKLLFEIPHFHVTPGNSEELAKKFIAELQLHMAESDLDK
jgi:hypothetical protein